MKAEKTKPDTGRGGGRGDGQFPPPILGISVNPVRSRGGGRLSPQYYFWMVRKCPNNQKWWFATPIYDFCIPVDF